MLVVAAALEACAPFGADPPTIGPTSSGACSRPRATPPLGPKGFLNHWNRLIQRHSSSDSTMLS
eukprot:10622662-Lingulodinium_polyedra.AAC.1